MLAGDRALLLTCLLIILPCFGLSCTSGKQCVVEIDSKGKLRLVNASSALRRLIIRQFENEENKKTAMHKDCAVTSCKRLKELDPYVTSGLYWIDPDGGSHTNAFQAFCDMETDGGGWTLVYSYTFTKYGAFNNGGNAVTPRPNWSASAATVPVSTTAPKRETDFNALEFNKWRQIGSEVLIKSNINNWVACSPGTGSLVLMKAGSVNCKIVKRVTSKCPLIKPTKLGIGSTGPNFSATSLYYYFDGSTSVNWPTHDPCSTNAQNQLKDVYNPRGNIYIR